ncbi:MAG: glucans biosynthesis glucosyltransferase MdoH [Methylobacteriaceae bacterium]|nr:glucans biosynthesis glucosyltransferase MdoH [Methylobacteriaceae bacterium]
MPAPADAAYRPDVDAALTAAVPGESAVDVVAMPPEAPLAMPKQSLRTFNRLARRRWAAPELAYTPWMSRLFVFGGTLAITAYGAEEMYRVVNVGGVTTLEWALLVLFVINFSWIVLTFTSSIIGFLWLLLMKPRAPKVPASLRGRTAVVMPIYNEAPSRVFGAVEAIWEAIETLGLGAHFDFFFLSDTTDPTVWIAEERLFLTMRERLGQQARFYYRHRPKNIDRKAGNIADFVSRWGGSYDHMVVLDADSLMTGHAIVSLAAAMEADPDSGIIQTLPLSINRNTLFARVQQFAARIYGPVLAAGLAVWMGRDGNYWGHNAIIRTAAFAAHCGLPDLKGRPPFGGHILSHDFVEAALIRRAGYAVYMLPVLGGSFEESPPSLIDLAARDRRWCQGNLQHLRILPARGLHIVSRQHFMGGIMGYVASPFWMAQLVVGIVLVFQASYFRPEYFSGEFTLFPAWPRFDAARALELFILTMAILLAPKVFGLILSLLEGGVRRQSGGAVRLILSVCVEIIISSLLAPIMMLIQTGSVMRIVFGFDTGWKPQRRDDGSIPFEAIFRRHRSHTLMGLLTLLAGFMISPSLAAWMSPTIAGLVLAVFLSWASGQKSIGLALKWMGFLVTPEESSPPPIAVRAEALTRQLEQFGFDEADPLLAIYRDPALRAAHEAMLPTARRRRRGNIKVDRAMAETKLSEAATIEEAVTWLQPKERMVVLHDRALLALLARLPDTSSAG